MFAGLARHRRTLLQLARRHLAADDGTAQVIHRFDHDPAGAALAVHRATARAQQLGILEQQAGRRTQRGFLGLQRHGQQGQGESKYAH
ncbi:hypothetical protein SDC9_199375 [bioreactor metagenome]|uniref:Uncharacterized protein n=1 Tax=bioreactor metagenome TaxID=1076179 RepID=A0A645IL32_9ZZZZ